ncbi:MAG: hypothetical protein PHS86_03190, partial [Syntrophaceae bacterium]|nr:hypothetical protein [Syntrophaceae bacterium]
MSQQQTLSSGNGGGITSVVGQSSLVAPTITVTTAGTTATVEDRAWITPYVVDPSATPGLRGTFQTIQAAIDQIVADGYGFLPYHTIYIRPGNYIEDIVFPSTVGIILASMGPLGAITQSTNVTIQGNVSFTAPGIAAFTGIDFINGVSNVIDTTNAVFCSFQDCVIDTIQGSGTVNMTNCSVSTIDLTGTVQIWNSLVGGNTAVFSGTVGIYRSTCNQIDVTANAQLTIEDCLFFSGSFIGSTGTFTGDIFADKIRMGSQGLFAVNGGSVTYGNITSYYTVGISSIFISGFTPTTITAIPHFGGNVKQMKTITTNYNLSKADCYVGVDLSGGSVTITLLGSGIPHAAPAVGQEFEFKIQTPSGANTLTLAGTIDGGTNLVVSNYAKLRWDGTAYWNITTAPATVDVTGTSLNLSVNKTFISDNGSLVTFTLPSSAALGDQITILGKGAGGWKVNQNASQV